MLTKQTMLHSLVLILLSAACYCHIAQAKDTKRVTGTISSVDWVGNKIAVRTMNFGKIDEITFTVTTETIIIKGTRTISFLDVKTSNPVAVEYVDNNLAGLTAVSIMVMQ